MRLILYDYKKVRLFRITGQAHFLLFIFQVQRTPWPPLPYFIFAYKVLVLKEMTVSPRLSTNSRIWV